MIEAMNTGPVRAISLKKTRVGNAVHQMPCTPMATIALLEGEKDPMGFTISMAGSMMKAATSMEILPETKGDCGGIRLARTAFTAKQLAPPMIASR